MEEGGCTFNIETGKAPWYRSLGTPSPRWVENIIIDLKELGVNARIWIDSAQDRDYWWALVNAALKLGVP
jgi:hypothetical protein